MSRSEPVCVGRRARRAGCVEVQIRFAPGVRAEADRLGVRLAPLWQDADVYRCAVSLWIESGESESDIAELFDLLVDAFGEHAIRTEPQGVVIDSVELTPTAELAAWTALSAARDAAPGRHVRYVIAGAVGRAGRELLLVETEPDKTSRS